MYLKPAYFGVQMRQGYQYSGHKHHDAVMPNNILYMRSVVGRCRLGLSKADSYSGDFLQQGSAR